MPLTCPVCRRYSSPYVSDVTLLEHMVEVHPTAPETLERVSKVRIASYGQNVGKTKPTV